MTSNKDTKPGIEVLKEAVSRFSCCHTDFVYRYTVKELLKISDAWGRSGWDIVADQWTTRQLNEAIELDRAPTWDDNEKPTYQSRTESA